MSTTKFANVKKSSLVILYSLYSLVLTQAWVLRFGEVGTSCLLTARPMLWPGQIINCLGDQGPGGGGAQSPALFYYLVATYSLMP